MGAGSFGGKKKHGPADDTPEGLQHLLGRHGSAVGELPDALHSEAGPNHDPQNDTPSRDMDGAAADIMDSIHGKNHKSLSKAMHDFMTLRESHMNGLDKAPDADGEVAMTAGNEGIGGEL
jgi:hypothetical protein